MTNVGEVWFARRVMTSSNLDLYKELIYAVFLVSLLLSLHLVDRRHRGSDIYLHLTTGSTGATLDLELTTYSRRRLIPSEDRSWLFLLHLDLEKFQKTIHSFWRYYLRTLFQKKTHSFWRGTIAYTCTHYSRRWLIPSEDLFTHWIEPYSLTHTEEALPSYTEDD